MANLYKLVQAVVAVTVVCVVTAPALAAKPTKPLLDSLQIPLCKDENGQVTICGSESSCPTNRPIELGPIEARPPQEEQAQEPKGPVNASFKAEYRDPDDPASVKVVHLYAAIVNDRGAVVEEFSWYGPSTKALAKVVKKTAPEALVITANLKPGDYGVTMMAWDFCTDEAVRAETGAPPGYENLPEESRQFISYHVYFRERSETDKSGDEDPPQSSECEYNLPPGVAAVNPYRTSGDPLFYEFLTYIDEPDQGIEGVASVEWQIQGPFYDTDGDNQLTSKDDNNIWVIPDAGDPQPTGFPRGKLVADGTLYEPVGDNIFAFAHKFVEPKEEIQYYRAYAQALDTCDAYSTVNWTEVMLDPADFEDEQLGDESDGEGDPLGDRGDYDNPGEQSPVPPLSKGANSVGRRNLGQAVKGSRGSRCATGCKPRPKSGRATAGPKKRSRRR